MGLAGARKRTKISHDPNNTTWSRSTSSYGHRIMTSQGWTPGSFLGVQDAAHAEHFTPASASHIRVSLKDDTLGLGAKAGGKNEEEPTGLDAFQDLLGRLNGKSDAEIETQQRKRDDVKLAGYVDKKYRTMTFVKGGMLVQEKMPESSPPTAREAPEESASSQETEPTKPEKRRKKKKEKDADSEGEIKDLASDDNQASEKSAKKKKEKKEKKEKKGKKEKKKNRKKDRKGGASESERETDGTSEEAKNSQKKRKRKDKEDTKLSEAVASDPSSTSSDTSDVNSSVTPKPASIATKSHMPVGRQFLRNRHIQQKKAALMDSKSLSEIFMVKS